MFQNVFCSCLQFAGFYFDTMSHLLREALSHLFFYTTLTCGVASTSCVLCSPRCYQKMSLAFLLYLRDFILAAETGDLETNKNQSDIKQQRILYNGNANIDVSCVCRIACRDDVHIVSTADVSGNVDFLRDVSGNVDFLRDVSGNVSTKDAMHCVFLRQFLYFCINNKNVTIVVNQNITRKYIPSFVFSV